MSVPYYVIIDLLKPYGVRHHDRSLANGKYAWVEFYSDEIGFISQDTIYIINLPRLGSIEIPDGFFCICATDDTEPNSLEGQHEDVYIVYCKGSPGSLVKRIREYIQEIQEWDRAMMKSIIAKDLMKLLSLSGEIIGNTLLLYNENFNLLAHYGCDSKDEAYYSQLISQKSLKNNVDDDFENTTNRNTYWPDVIKEEDEKLRDGDFKIITRTIRVENHQSGQIYMFCDGDGQTLGKYDLFNMMMERIEFFFMREAPNIDMSKKREGFLLDLIEERITDPTIIRHKSEYCEIPTNRLYCLLLLKYKRPLDDIKTFRLLGRLHEILPSSWAFQYKNSIVIINYYKTPNHREESETWIDLIKELCKENEIEIGFSMPESSIGNLHLAYKRAAMAVEYGRRVHKTLEHDGVEGGLDINWYRGYEVYAYETYYIYHIIDIMMSESKMILENSFCIKALAKLHAFDKEKKSDNLKLLYCYLVNECSASKTASEMHMHRNNVIYRINKIEESLGVSLDEYQFRFKFLLSYRVLDYYGMDYLDTINYSTIGPIVFDNDR